ncbi:MAG: outer membrane protein assembly factor BamD [Gammaproteobacteria bacterium]|nr:outer membrane protein assembly factor BamD [Gammaproteobacteria bacterium]
MSPISRPPAVRARIVGVAVLALLVLVGGCHGRRPERDNRRVTAEQLYRLAHKAMLSSDYEYAVRQYEALTSRFPFTDEARQARLDLIYVYYRKGEKESATDAAEQFLREYPTHPRIDYAWYMKGLIDFERQPYKVERWLGVDMARRPPSTAMQSINSFRVVVERYPKSIYAHDALRRMVYQRNRLAEYEVNVARYYVKRGAWLAASQRAVRVIEQFDGAPAVRQALAIMIECDQRLGLDEHARNLEQVYRLNYPDAAPGELRARRWWRLWR